MQVKNHPLLGLGFYLSLFFLLWFFICCATAHDTSVLCTKPCEISNVRYIEAIAGKDLYVLVMHIYGFESQDKAIAALIFELRKKKLTSEMGYATCFTASMEIEAKYQIRVGTLDVFVVKGVIACQD